ncbi:MAG: LytTR family DNA-binding domain-containing protein [Vicinamibacterales bacterium]
MTQALRVVIADDEPLAREGMRRALERIPIPATRIVAECPDGAEVLEVLAHARADVLLLDIEMPGLDGFAVLDRLEPEHVPAAVIFVTAYDEHAIRAFEVHALDYLLKPVPAERLKVALQRAAQRCREARVLERERVDEIDSLSPHDTVPLAQILVRDRGRISVVLVNEIEWIEADAYYVRLHTGGGVFMLRERMAVLEAKLDAKQFVRTHRSAIVRIDCVRQIRAVSRYEHEVWLTSGAKAPLSRERRARLETLLAEARR